MIELFCLVYTTVNSGGCQQLLMNPGCMEDSWEGFTAGLSTGK